MNDTLLTLADIMDRPRDFIPLVAIVGGLFICVVSIIASVIGSTVRSSQHERSRREIAAYIAEGSMTTEDGERLLKAGPKNKSCC